MPRSLTYSPLSRLVRDLHAVHAEAERLSVSVDEVHERRATADEARSVEGERMTRRTFVRRAALAGAGVATAGAWLPRSAFAATAPRIVVVGAGLAGLRTAHKLANRAHPLAATVYEADTTHIEVAAGASGASSTVASSPSMAASSSTTTSRRSAVSRRPSVSSSRSSTAGTCRSSTRSTGSTASRIPMQTRTPTGGRSGSRPFAPR
jgi:hypothetical protein